MPESTHSAFIQAILEKPDDRDAYLIYADWLEEQNDPRGEFIRVQWKLEDGELLAEDRAKLREREKELFDHHGREWLGSLAGELIDGERPESLTRYRGTPCEFEFHRGFLDCLTFNILTLIPTKIAALPDVTNLVRRLSIFDTEGAWELFDLSWNNLRTLSVSGYVEDDLVGFVGRLPRLEELSLRVGWLEIPRLMTTQLPHLQVLCVHNTMGEPLTRIARNVSFAELQTIDLFPHVPEVGDEPYLNNRGLTALCRATHLTNLRHLRLLGSDFGDEGIRILLQSDLFYQLQTLDLTYGAITDVGADLLANADLSGLRQLNLTSNYLSVAAIERLKATGVALQTASQLTGEPRDNGQHLMFGDIE